MSVAPASQHAICSELMSGHGTLLSNRQHCRNAHAYAKYASVSVCVRVQWLFVAAILMQPRRIHGV